MGGIEEGKVNIKLGVKASTRQPGRRPMARRVELKTIGRTTSLFGLAIRASRRIGADWPLLGFGGRQADSAPRVG